jgi:hypothetical protein
MAAGYRLDRTRRKARTARPTNQRITVPTTIAAASGLPFSGDAKTNQMNHTANSAVQAMSAQRHRLTPAA